MKRSSALSKAIAKKKKKMAVTGAGAPTKTKVASKKRKTFDESHSHHRKPKKPRAKAGMNAAEQDEEDLRYLERVLGIRRGKPLPRDFREDGDELYDLLESLRSDSEQSGDDDEDSTSDPLYCPPTDDPLPESVQKELDAEMQDGAEDLVITDDMLARAQAAPALSAEGAPEEEEAADDGAKEEEKVTKKTKKSKKEEKEEQKEEKAFDEDAEEAARRKQRAEEREEVLRTTEGKAVLRVVKGAVNKLCEANLEPIFNQVEALRLQYSLPVVNEALSKCVLESCVLSGERSGATAQIVVDCALVALLNAVVGTEVGGLVLEKVAERYTDARAAGADALPVATTMAVTLAHLYNFGVASCTLVYDLVRRLVAAFGPADIEVLLALLRQAGPQLRHDDPSALKDIVLAVQGQAHKATTAAAAAGNGDEDGASSGFSARVQYMLDTIYELKNNRQAETPELLLVQRLRKTAHRVVEKRGTTLSANEIRTTWDDLTAADPQGRWWAVGSAFATIDIAPGRAAAGAGSAAGAAAGGKGERRQLQSAGTALDEQMMALAKKHRMNTDTKRAVFAIMVSGEDYIDTFQKLMKLGLKGSAQRDIPAVLVYLCGREKHYNPYYEHVAQQLCSLGHSMCFTFQTTFWDTFKPLSAAQATPTTLAQGREASNVGQLLASLIAAGFLSLLCLKTVPFEALNATGVLFFRVLFTHLLTDNDEATVERVFQRLAASHGVASGERRNAEADITVIKLKEGISLFFLQAFGSITIYKNEEDSEKRAKKLLKQRVALANGILLDSVSADMF